ncbi:MAG TPA: alpha/beta fold hydrolase [Byssovorax sp.]|jgi:pimeloyl-ACP methyl ester carboxylesterase
MTTPSMSGSNKSTNVRAFTIERAVRAGLHAVEAASPPLAAAIGERLMFHTLRARRRDDERAVLARGRRFEVESRAGRVVAWSFGEGPLVVLVHGWNGRGGQLRAFVDPLVERGARVVLFDAPGHGSSAGSESSLVDFADALDAVLDEARPAFGPAQAVIAHSMGGAAVTYAMSRTKRSPATSLDRGIRDTGLPVRRFAFVAPPIDVRDFVRGFRRRFDLTEETERALGRRLVARFSLDLAELYAPALAEELTAPLLVVHDADDREVPLRCGETLAAAWPGAELEVTHGLGHTRVLRDPGVIERISDFVMR